MMNSIIMGFLYLFFYNVFVVRVCEGGGGNTEHSSKPAFLLCVLDRHSNRPKNRSFSVLLNGSLSPVKNGKIQL